MKATDQQKADKRQRDTLQHVCNKLVSNFSFKLIKTWRDVYVTTGIDNATIASSYTNADVAITFLELKAYCSELKSKLETSSGQKGIAAGGNLPKPTLGKITDLIIDESAPVISKPIVVVAASSEVKPLPVETQLTNKLDEDYGLVPSPNEKAFLYWFQKKCCAELLRGFGITN